MPILKKILGDNSFTDFMYEKLILLETKIEKLKKRYYMNKYALLVLHEIQDILSTQKNVFFFDMGTLLGIIREGHLLEHDLDIDIGVFASLEDEKKRLLYIFLLNGCKFHASYSIEGIGIVEYSLLYHNIKFDINFYSSCNERSICYLMAPPKAESDFPSRINLSKNERRVVRLSVPSIKGVDYIDFHGKQINIPINAEEYLTSRYGDNWRIPDKKYKYWLGNSASMTELIGVCKTEL